MNFILKRNNYFYFRIWIPLDLRLHFKKKEICKSLKTDNFKNAKVIASKLLYSTERLFLHLRSGMYTDTQMKQLVKDYLHAYLARCESVRSIAMVRYESAGQQQITAGTDVQVIVDTSVKAIDDLIEARKRMLLKNDFSGVGVRVGWYMENKGLTIDEGSVEYATFCREILKAEIEALKVEKERMSGNYGNRYDNFLENSIAPVPPVVQHIETINTPPEPIVSLSEMIEGNIRSPRRSLVPELPHGQLSPSGS